MASEMEEADDPTSLGQRSEAESRELMGMFDAPAFARRGQAMETYFAQVHAHCRTHRLNMLDMVRMRLKQWAHAADGPDAWREVFAGPIAELWPLSQADDPAWSLAGQPIRRKRVIARDLVASVERFNSRWTRHVRGINLEPLNRMIREYNQFYILEKECVLGSARLAARFFRPEPELTAEVLFQMHPTLPVPDLA